MVTYTCPNKHATRQQLGKWQPSGKLIRLRVGSAFRFYHKGTYDRFTGHDTDPEESTGQSIILSNRADIVDPPHDTFY